MFVRPFVFLPFNDDPGLLQRVSKQLNTLTRVGTVPGISTRWAAFFTGEFPRIPCREPFTIGPLRLAPKRH